MNYWPANSEHVLNGTLGRYPAYKDSGVEWMGEIPAHWEVKRAKTLLSRNDGGVWGTDFDDFGVVVLRSTEQTVDGKWNIREPARRQLTPSEHAACHLKDGDLVITKSSGSAHHIGKTSIVTRDVEALNCCHSNFMQRLRVKRNVAPRYMWYMLNGELGRKQFVYYSDTTTGLANLNAEIIGMVYIARPALSEQRAIATFLDRETARIDTLVAKKERLIELLQEKRSALISHAVTRGLDPDVPTKDSGIEWLGEVPAHWEIVPVYVRYEVALGKMLDLKRIRGDWLGKYIRNIDVQWDSVNTRDLPQMDFGPVERDRYRLEPGDLLVCEGGEVGRTAVWQGAIEECFYQKAIHRVRPRSQRDVPRFFYYVMYSLAKRGVFVAGSNPNTINHLTAIQLSHYRLIFPPSDEQYAIAKFLDRETAKIDALIAKVRDAIDRLKELRQALISAAVTGKIDVRSLE